MKVNEIGFHVVTERLHILWEKKRDSICGQHGSRKKKSLSFGEGGRPKRSAWKAARAAAKRSLRWLVDPAYSGMAGDGSAAQLFARCAIGAEIDVSFFNSHTFWPTAFVMQGDLKAGDSFTLYEFAPFHKCSK